MITSQAELDSFHDFASERLTIGGSDLSMEELVAQWRANQERDAVNARIRKGLADIDAGLGRPAAEAMKDIRQKLDIPAE